jgi:hypothetical protein
MTARGMIIILPRFAVRLGRRMDIFRLTRWGGRRSWTGWLAEGSMSSALLKCDKGAYSLYNFTDHW